MVAPAVLRSVRTYLRRLQDQGIPVSLGVVFGSQAAGQADEWSDVDLLVVSPRFDGPIDRDDVNQLWRVAARTDSRIEPIPCGEKRWREDMGSPIIEIARAEGTPVQMETVG
jgi:predicted nucleotidyltransferase